MQPRTSSGERIELGAIVKGLLIAGVLGAISANGLLLVTASRAEDNKARIEKVEANGDKTREAAIRTEEQVKHLREQASRIEAQNAEILKELKIR